ncbi:Ger(x)C family spore germination protein [Paenibacillus rhizovicinus]|uniref:Ger(X)C family spore germination protein n=1 Tax=Paenibacillus rhizovicinus TaxID=2704463 RepID=A0A6C0NUF6_9BACL|nr:Ger(x)C family spore germination protein [Paenibacillus rhizovicinus]QHW29854.1 Ger(x)C family spore germination protein [Paenibacillus rhizovicinus]
MIGSALRKWSCMFLVLSMAAALGGCWSSVELNERAFARIMMLDESKNGIELTLGFPLPNRLNGGVTSGATTSTQPSFALVTKTGRDVGEAFRLIQGDLSRQITFGQLRNILISQAFAQDGIYPIVDFLLRDTSIHINANVYVTEGNAKQVGNIPLTFERFLTDILTSYAKQQTTLAVTAKDVLVTAMTGGDFVLPMLVFGVMGAESEKGGNKWMGTDGAAVFHQGKLVAQLDSKELRAAQWIRNEMKEGVMRFASPSDGKMISLLMYGHKTIIRPVLKGDRIRFDITCNGSAKIIASESTLDVTDRKNIAALEQRINESLKTRILQTIAHLQSQRSDAFLLGQRIRWQSPRKWNKIKGNWSDIYQNQIAVDAKVSIAIKWFGGAQKPVWNIDLFKEEGSG